MTQTKHTCQVDQPSTLTTDLAFRDFRSREQDLGSPDRRTYAVTFVRAGLVRRRDNTLADWLIPAETLQKAAPLLNDRAVFVDHPAPPLGGLGGAGYPSVRNLVGVTFGAEYNPFTDSIDGYIRMYQHDQGQWVTDLVDQLIADQQAGLPTPDVGLSLVFFGKHSWRALGTAGVSQDPDVGMNGTVPLSSRGVRPPLVGQDASVGTNGVSQDPPVGTNGTVPLSSRGVRPPLVGQDASVGTNGAPVGTNGVRPATQRPSDPLPRGSWRGALNSSDEGEPTEIRVTDEITHVESCDLVFGPAAQGRIRQLLSRAPCGDFAGPTSYGAGPTSYGAGPTSFGPVGAGPRARPHPALQTLHNQRKDNSVTTSTELPHNMNVAAMERPAADTGGPEAPPATSPMTPPIGGPGGIESQIAALSAQVDRLADALARAIEPTVVKGMGTPPTPPSGKVPVRSGEGLGGLSAGLGGRAGALQMWSSVDRIQLAYEKLMGLPISHDVPRLTGIRELYTLLTGDRCMQGRYDPELAMLANTGYDGAGNNADTTTMAEITRNVMNKALVAQVDLLSEYRWWERIAHVEDFQSLQDISWVRVGGIGDIPTVAEKGEYTQLAWDDARVAGAWVKKGGYLPLSLEMIDRDDVAAWRAVPRQLATAAEVTLSANVSALFTDNSGVGPSITTEGSTAYTFSSTWGNLINQPLDYTNWGLAIDTMYQLAQLNVSGRAQAVRPKFLLVPIELEGAAVAAATSPLLPGSDYNDRVPVKRLLPEQNIITVPHWTDESNWAAVADPNLCPFAGVGFRFGRSPELFTAADPNTHLLFTNDVLPIKVRWFFAVSVIDPRGAVKSNN